MVSYSEIKKNTYYDSVTLMLISGRLEAVDGIEEAAVMMGTDHNKLLMKNAGILDPEAESCGPNDLLIGLRALTQEALDAAKACLKAAFEEKQNAADDAGGNCPQPSMEAAAEKLGEPNVCVISLPGRYAKRQAMKAMRMGMHVLLFSDNVSVEEEIELKRYAAAHGLLMMGPDCGTAIIGGAALGFANVIRRGNVGIVAAAGTGLQEVAVLVERFGSGISEAIGTGGRDVTAQVGGVMMLSALRALEADPQTRVIGIVSKPPAPEVLEKIKNLPFSKPVVCCLLGAPVGWAKGTKLIETQTLEEAAAAMAALDQGRQPEPLADIAELPLRLPAGRHYVRGLYSGGTLCYEAIQILREELGSVRSNLGKTPETALEDVEVSVGNTLVDMGDDYFTDGMPHPMIDMRLRSERICREAADPETGVILLDCVLGFGCHPDPAGALAEAIRTAQKEHPGVIYVASVCGTDRDEQNRAEQVRTLREAGVIVAESNARAAKITARLLNAEGGKCNADQ